MVPLKLVGHLHKIAPGDSWRSGWNSNPWAGTPVTEKGSMGYNFLSNFEFKRLFKLLATSDDRTNNINYKISEYSHTTLPSLQALYPYAV